MTVDTKEMLLIHRVIRREIGALPGLVRGAAGDVPRARLLATHAEEMLDFLHHHHIGEDQLLWPVLRPRVALEADLIDRMEAQHHQIAEAIGDVRSDLPRWAETADAETGERIAGRLDEANAVMLEHLEEEEERILPLVAINFSQSEWDALGKHGMASVPGKRRLVTLAHILEDADPGEEREFLKKVPPPARIAYKLLGRRQHAREVSAIRR